MRNFNDLCRVKVLPRGKIIIEEKRKQLLAGVSSGQQLLDGVWKLDQNDILEVSLWEVMNLFGRHTFMGSDSPIAMEFELVEDAPAQKPMPPLRAKAAAVALAAPAPHDAADSMDFILYRSSGGGWERWTNAPELTGLVQWAENSKKQHAGGCRIVDADGLVVYPPHFAGSKFNPDSKMGVVPKPRYKPRGTPRGGRRKKREVVA